MAKAKSEKKRADQAPQGLTIFEQWVYDLMRIGLGEAQLQNPATWRAVSQQLADAKASAMARRLSEFGLRVAQDKDWADRALEQFARQYLLARSFPRLSQLPEGIQADIQGAVGFTVKQKELLAQAGVHDIWLSVGRKAEVSSVDKLITQRTWLLGMRTGRAVLLLDFKHLMAPTELDRSLPPTTWIETECVYFPSAYPQRALAKARNPEPMMPNEHARALKKLVVDGLPNAYPDSSAALNSYAAALALNPWLERFAMALSRVTPVADRTALYFVDAQGDGLPTGPHFEEKWKLMALSGGAPITVFGEWDGTYFLPMSALAEGRFIAF
ncbi:MAG: hypothetical protein OHK0023_23380 [Anaerolineae bacterium]